MTSWQPGCGGGAQRRWGCSQQTTCRHKQTLLAVRGDCESDSEQHRANCLDLTRTAVLFPTNSCIATLPLKTCMITCWLATTFSYKLQ